MNDEQETSTLLRDPGSRKSVGIGIEDEMELMQAVEHYATAMKKAQQYGNKHGDMDAANNAWRECKKVADDLRIGKEMLWTMMAEHGKLLEENKRLREILGDIKNYAHKTDAVLRWCDEGLNGPNV